MYVARRWLLHCLVGATLGATVVGGIGLPISSAHSMRGAAHAKASARIKDRTAVILADALRASLKAKGAVIVSMRRDNMGHQAGYLVTWARGRTEGRLFVNARTGRVRRMGALVALSARAQTGASLPSFLASLESYIGTLAGQPVSAQTENNGALTVFTVNVSGQTITVTVNTSATSANTGGATMTIQAPPVSMEAATTAALGSVASLAIPTLAAPYAVSATLRGWSGLSASGDGSGWGDQASASATPEYQIVVASGAGGSAFVDESAQGAASTAGGSAAPELLGIDTLIGLGGDQSSIAMSAAAPAVTLDTAVTSALATDQGAIPVRARLRMDNGSAVWQVTLANQDGSYSIVSVDASTGAVLGTQSVGGNNGGSSGGDQNGNQNGNGGNGDN